MEIIIPAIPPSYNKYMGNSKSHFVYHDKKKKWLWLVRSALPHSYKTFDVPVAIKIEYFFKNKRRRDLDNYSGKFIMDALVYYNIIRDDSIKYVPLLILKGNLGSKQEKTVINIKKIEELEFNF
jgi:Holliday junction resolvase RusA-like endonuclease